MVMKAIEFWFLDFNLKLEKFYNFTPVLKVKNLKNQ